MFIQKGTKPDKKCLTGPPVVKRHRKLRLEMLTIEASLLKPKVPRYPTWQHGPKGDKGQRPWDATLTKAIPTTLGEDA